MCVKRVPQKNRKSSAPVERNFFGTKYGKNKEKSFEIRRFRSFLGGDKRDRTADLLNAIQALSQLSYTPKFSCAVRQLLYYSTHCENVKGELLFF